MLKKTDTITLTVEQATNHLSFVAGVVYKCKPGCRFEYVMPTVTGDYFVADCAPCDRHGNLIKGYESGIPVDHSDISHPIIED